jgi:nucleotide-binding universal stress UspA family protein
MNSTDESLKNAAGTPEQSSVAGHGHQSKRLILVGVDGSESSLDALRKGVELATALGAPLEAVTFWNISPSPSGGYYPIPGWSPEEDAREIQASAVEAVFGDTTPDWFTATTINGSAARSLITESERAELLILGSRGRGGFAGLLLGSVSRACAAQAQCPVLIMH